jgi:hypothetical protein
MNRGNASVVSHSDGTLSETAIWPVIRATRGGDPASRLEERPVIRPRILQTLH